MNEERNAWEQIAGEPDKWFARFDRYRLLGPNRSIEECWRQEQAKVSEGRRPTKHWYEAAEKYSWRDRAGAWDEELRARQEEQALEEWATRGQQWKEQRYQIAEKLRLRIEQMLNFPLVEVVRKEETVDPNTGHVITQTTIYAPAKWSYGNMARLIRELRQLSLDMYPEGDIGDLPPTEHHVTFERDTSYVPPMARTSADEGGEDVIEDVIEEEWEDDGEEEEEED